MGKLSPVRDEKQGMHAPSGRDKIETPYTPRSCDHGMACPETLLTRVNLLRVELESKKRC